MVAASASLAITLLVCGLVQLGFVGRFHRFSLRKEPDVAPHWTPQSAVILCVRGLDPCLDDCLQGLLNQDYPNYRVDVVVDSASDPAWPTLLRWQETAGKERMRITLLQTRLKTCSLKCSSLIQAFQELTTDDEVVVMIDADVVPRSTWLRQLVQPLHNPKVGLSTGNRWYEPTARRSGTKVRSCWNSGAVVQMFCFEIPWGGSLALRREDIETHDVLAHWSRSFNDDVILRDLFARSGKRLHRVPDLLLVNREEISLRRLFGWIVRQCVHFRHYHQGWKLVAGFNLLVAFLTLLHAVLPLVALAAGETLAAKWFLVGLAGYYLNQLTLSVWVEAIAHNVLNRQGQTVARLGWNHLWVLIVAHVLYCSGFITALFRRQIQWRGVLYRIHAPLNVEVLQDVPVDANLAVDSLSIV